MNVYFFFVKKVEILPLTSAVWFAKLKLPQILRIGSFSVAAVKWKERVLVEFWWNIWAYIQRVVSSGVVWFVLQAKLNF